MEKLEADQPEQTLERTYIAHELHDSLAQTIASLRYHVRNLDHAIQGGSECEMYEILEVLENNVETANTELRELITKFRAPLDEETLVPAIESTIRKFTDETGIKTIFYNKLKNIEFRPSHTTQVVRIVQEALANVKKHAHASNVRVVIRQESDEYHVVVEDTGRGFDFALQKETAEGHFGLKTMFERAERIKGELIIESEPLEGTRVHLIFSDPENEQ